jgi:hypothetical protein
LAATASGVRTSGATTCGSIRPRRAIVSGWQVSKTSDFKSVRSHCTSGRAKPRFGRVPMSAGSTSRIASIKTRLAPL